jgi:DNA repair protein RadD
LTLRPYQIEAVDSALSQVGATLIVAPTGSGKSVIISELIRCLNSKILILAHVKELVEQNYEEYDGTNKGIYSAGLGRKDRAQVLFAGIQSIYPVINEFLDYDTIIIDEAHLIPRDDDTRYYNVLNLFRKKRIIGLTATPYRLDSGWLHKNGGFFESICYEIHVQALIDQGYLCNVVSRGASVAIDTTKVKHKGGEFDVKDLETRAVSGDTTKKIIADVIKKGHARKSWLIFACGALHAWQIKDELDFYNISNDVIMGETSKEVRDQSIKKHRQGEVQCLININVLTTGYNNPMLDLIVMMRPTESTSLYVQMIGRGMRIAPNKMDCLVLDYSGNVLRHGPIDDVRIKEVKEGDGEGVAPAKECPVCQYFIHSAKRTCPHCGYEFPKIETELKKKASDGAILKKQVEPVRRLIVNTVLSVHTKTGSPNSVKITYYDGLGGSWSEWLFPESSNQYMRWNYKQLCKSLGVECFETAKEFVDNVSISMDEIYTIPDGKFTKIVKRVLQKEIV